jgi:hypothetical protein
MFAVKGFDQASAFWFSPGAMFLDDVFIQVTDASPFDRADMDEHIGAAGVGLNEPEASRRIESFPCARRHGVLLSN